VLDTDIVSAFAPGRPHKPPPDPAVATWVRRNEDQLFLSAVTVVEIETGILKLGRISPGRWHTQLSQWFGVFLEQFTKRVIDVDLEVARLAATIADRHAVRGVDPGIADTIIAATALRRGMTLLTRNLRHFDVPGLIAIDPFNTVPP
jgi:predicted nucleic acid-binding protein